MSRRRSERSKAATLGISSFGMVPPSQYDIYNTTRNNNTTSMRRKRGSERSDQTEFVREACANPTEAAWTQLQQFSRQIGTPKSYQSDKTRLCSQLAEEYDLNTNNLFRIALEPIPKSFLDIDGTPLIYPYLAEDGNSYNLSTLRRFFENNEFVPSPRNPNILMSRHFEPNPAVRATVRKWLTAHGYDFQEQAAQERREYAAEQEQEHRVDPRQRQVQKSRTRLSSPYSSDTAPPRSMVKLQHFTNEPHMVDISNEEAPMSTQELLQQRQEVSLLPGQSYIEQYVPPQESEIQALESMQNISLSGQHEAAEIKDSLHLRSSTQQQDFPNAPSSQQLASYTPASFLQTIQRPKRKSQPTKRNTEQFVEPEFTGREATMPALTRIQANNVPQSPANTATTTTTTAYTPASFLQKVKRKARPARAITQSVQKIGLEPTEWHVGDLAWTQVSRRNLPIQQKQFLDDMSLGAGTAYIYYTVGPHEVTSVDPFQLRELSNEYDLPHPPPIPSLSTANAYRQCIQRRASNPEVQRLMCQLPLKNLRDRLRNNQLRASNAEQMLRDVDQVIRTKQIPI
jgi:hypothetical protein